MVSLRNWISVSGSLLPRTTIESPLTKSPGVGSLIDTSGEQLSYSDLARGQSDLAGWPRGESRRAAAEKVLDRSGMGADAALALMSDGKPTTVEGAIAYASALQQRGRQDEARALLREAEEGE